MFKTLFGEKKGSCMGEGSYGMTCHLFNEMQGDPKPLFYTSCLVQHNY